MTKRSGCELIGGNSESFLTMVHILTCYSIRYMDKRVFIQLNGDRKVTGVLRGFDPFMNLVLDEAIEETNPEKKNPIGMVVSGDWDV
jgi:small nuclear ribonucleoprotein (snRNP)-like protein